MILYVRSDIRTHELLCVLWIILTVRHVGQRRSRGFQSQETFGCEDDELIGQNRRRETSITCFVRKFGYDDDTNAGHWRHHVSMRNATLPVSGNPWRSACVAHGNSSRECYSSRPGTKMPPISEMRVSPALLLVSVRHCLINLAGSIRYKVETLFSQSVQHFPHTCQLHRRSCLASKSSSSSCRWTRPQWQIRKYITIRVIIIVIIMTTTEMMTMTIRMTTTMTMMVMMTTTMTTMMGWRRRWQRWCWWWWRRRRWW